VEQAAGRAGPTSPPQHPALPPAAPAAQSLATDTVTLNATQFTGNGQWVSASWSLQTVAPHSSDTIALYVAPVAATFNASYAIKYKQAGTASGSAAFRLLNVRADYQFALVTNRTGTPTVLATSPVLTNAAPNEPTQLHLVPGGPASEMTVQWVTRDAGQPVVEWGERGGAAAGGGG